MCMECSVVIEKMFPELNHEERMEILWSKTSFPFGGPNEILRHLLQYKRAIQLKRSQCNLCGKLSPPLRLVREVCKRCRSR